MKSYHVPLLDRSGDRPKKRKILNFHEFLLSQDQTLIFDPQVQAVFSSPLSMPLSPYGWRVLDPENSRLERLRLRLRVWRSCWRRKVLLTWRRKVFDLDPWYKHSLCLSQRSTKSFFMRPFKQDLDKGPVPRVEDGETRDKEIQEPKAKLHPFFNFVNIKVNTESKLNTLCFHVHAHVRTSRRDSTFGA